MKMHVLLAGVVVAMFGASALAHPGPRVWLNVESGKIKTYAGAYPPGDPSAYSLSRVFTQAMTDEGGGIFDTDFPGFQMKPGGTIAASTNFSYNITGALLWYNAAGAKFETVAAHFGGTPPQFDVTNELFQTKRTAAGPVGGDLAFAFNGAAGDHNHLTYTMLGDGTTPSNGPDGIYALPLQLTSSGLTNSDTYWLLLGRNASAADLNSAAGVANQTLVPEPAAIALLGVLAPMLMRRREK